MNIRILYYAFVDLDIPNACQTHTLGIIEGLCNNKCKVDAILPRPKKIRPRISGTQFFYIWPWQFSKIGMLLAKCLGGLYLFLLCLFRKYNAVYVRELEVNPFPRWCSKIFNIPLFLEINGLLLLNPEANKENGKYLRKIWKNQKLDFNLAEGLIVSSFPRSRWIIQNYNLRPNKVHTILNGTNISPNTQVNRSASIKRLKLPVDGFFLGFLGTVWKHYDLNSVIQAMTLCKNKIPNLHLIIVGGGPELKNVKEMANNEGILSKIIDTGFLQLDELSEAMGVIDIGLMNLTIDGLDDLGPITTRFSTYAAFGIPVIANTLYLDSYPDEIIKGLFTVPPEDPSALKDRIIHIYKNPKERREKASIIKNFAFKKLTWDATSKDILEIIRNQIRIR